MAKLSPAKRKLKQTRRTNNQLKRALHQESVTNYKLYSTLMMVLAQKGGEVTVTRGTAQQVIEGMGRLSYVVEAGANESEFVIRQILKEDTSSTIEDIPSQGENIGYYDSNDASAEAIVDTTSESSSVLITVQPDSDGSGE